MNSLKIIKGYAFAILSAVIFGSMPLMAKFIYLEGVNSLTLVFLRNFLALPIICVLALFQNKSLKVPIQTFAKIIPIAVFGCCLTPLLLFSSYNFIDSGTATVIHFVYPTMVLVIGFLFFSKKLEFKNIMCVVICIVGILLFYNPNANFNYYGSCIAFLSGVTFASVLIAVFDLKKIDKKD